MLPREKSHRRLTERSGHEKGHLKGEIQSARGEKGIILWNGGAEEKKDTC